MDLEIWCGFGVTREADVNNLRSKINRIDSWASKQQIEIHLVAQAVDRVEEITQDLERLVDDRVKELHQEIEEIKKTVAIAMF